MLENEMANDILLEQFKKMYSGYLYPFIRSDEIIAGLPKEKQHKYFKEASRISESKVFNQEVNEITRQLYHKIVEEIGVEEKKTRAAAYRGGLIAIRLLQNRFIELEVRDPSKQIEAIKKANKEIDEIIGNNNETN